MDKKLRVLHAPIVALYQPALMVKGLRERGVAADLLYMQIGGNVDYSCFTFSLGDEIILKSDAVMGGGRYGILHKRT